MANLTRISREYPEDKPKKIVEWTVDAPKRSTLRRLIITKWLKEDEYTSYRYNVEQCDDGSRVYLMRPTFLNKGFDFEVRLEGFHSVLRRPKGKRKRRKSERPSHKDVVHDIKRKVRANPKKARALHAAICSVFHCQPPAAVLKKHRQVATLTPGLPTQKLLLVLKWLFIEQDITYWLGRGRHMLMSGIEKNVFRLR